MIISINQPGYIPWLGYFDRIARSDLHIVLDHVQFGKNSFTNRNKVRTPQGWSWLSVPLKTKGKFEHLAIHSLEIANSSNWRRKHWNALRSSYEKTAFFKKYSPFLEEVYRKEWTYFNPLLREINCYLLAELGIKTTIRYSSELGVEGKKEVLIHNLCQRVKATTYISGPFGRDYINNQAFTESGIRLLFHDYQHPTYAQKFSTFEPYMSVLDILFNHGQSSLEMIMENQSLKER